MPSWIWVIILLVVLLAASAAAKHFGLLSPAKPGDAVGPSLPYRKREYLLSKGEAAFHHALRNAVGQRWLIFAKVRLADLLLVEATGQDRTRHFNRIASKHADFVLCDPASVRPLLAIELDDKSHEREDRTARDTFVDAALRAGGLPLLRVKAAAQYTPSALSAEIESALSSGREAGKPNAQTARGA